MSDGRMVAVGAGPGAIELTTFQLIGGMKSIRGWASGIPRGSEDTLCFAEMSGVRPMIGKYPLAKADEAYAHMINGKAEFRVVWTMDNSEWLFILRETSILFIAGEKLR